MMFSKKDIQAKYRKLELKVRKFLQKPQCREFLIFSFFVFIAFIFWILQTLNDTYETEFTIPLRLKNVPNDVVITSDLPDNLQVTVKDKGTVLVNYMLGQSFMPINVEFEDYKQKGTHVRILSTELQRKVLGQLAASTALRSVKPDTLDFIYTQGKAKKVPVRMVGTATAERQYYIAGRNFVPDSVIVYAPQTILDTIKAAYTEEVHLENIVDTVHLNAKLETIKGAKFVPDYVDLCFYADIFTEKTVEVPVVGVGFPKNKLLKTFPSKVNVTFQVGLSRFKNITADDFSIEVSYEELKYNRSDKCKLRLKTLPVGATHIRISPEKVDYLIEQIVE